MNNILLLVLVGMSEKDVPSNGKSISYEIDFTSESNSRVIPFKKLQNISPGVFDTTHASKKSDVSDLLYTVISRIPHLSAAFIS